MKTIILFATLALAAVAQVGFFKAGNQQAVTGSAVQLPSFTANVTCVKIVAGGTQTVFLGGAGVTTSTGYPLAAGESACFPAINLNQLYVIAANTGSTVAWFGTSYQ